MLDHVTTVRSRELGHILQDALRNTSHNASEIAGLLGWSPSKMSRLLTGKRLPSAVDIATFLTVCGIVGRRRDEILELAEHAHETIWWQDNDARQPYDRMTLTDNMAIASEITTYHNTRVPDLLQAPGYTRALLRTSIPTVEVDQRATAIAQRQHVLDGRIGPCLRAFVDAHALTHTGMGDPIMTEQVDHLVRLSTQPGVDIRVVPERDCITQLAPFTLLTFTTAPTVVYLELMTSAVFIERPETVEMYELVVAALDELALDTSSSRTWLATIAEQRGARAERRAAIT